MKNISFLFLVLFVSCQLAGQVNWSKHATPVLEKGPADSWEENGVGFPSVLLKDDTLHMWYSGLNDDFLAIGHAYSNDGGLTWTKNAKNPVLIPGSSGSFDEQRAYIPKVIYHDGQFHMWYLGAKDDLEKLGYATSPDGVNWTKEASNPVANYGVGPVLYRDGLYRMWFNYESGNAILPGYATSPDGKTWTQSDKKPVIPSGSNSDWDYPRVQAQSVVYHSGAYHLFFSGGKFYNWQEGYATSEDGLNWTKHSSGPVVRRGEDAAWDSEYVSFSSVILDDTEKKWKMWYYGGINAFAGSIGFAEAWTVSVKNHETSAGISVIPNPVGDILTVNTGISNNGTLEIFNLNGKMTYSREISKANISIDLSFLEKGLYFVRVSKPGSVETKKIVKL